MGMVPLQSESAHLLLPLLLLLSLFLGILFLLPPLGGILAIDANELIARRISLGAGALFGRLSAEVPPWQHCDACGCGNQKTGIPKWVARSVSGNMVAKTCGLPLRSFNFEPHPCANSMAVTGKYFPWFHDSLMRSASGVQQAWRTPRQPADLPTS